MGDPWHEFDVAAGLCALGEIKAELLPVAAVAAMERGCDAPSLGRLAAMDGAGWSEVEPEVARVFRERGLQVPDHDAAVKIVADDVLRQMVSGECSPVEGTTRLLRLSSSAATAGPTEDDLGTFSRLYADWYYSDINRNEDEVHREMLRQARALLDRGGVRIP
jgi:hypothetical protein